MCIRDRLSGKGINLTVYDKLSVNDISDFKEACSKSNKALLLKTLCTKRYRSFP